MKERRKKVGPNFVAFLLYIVVHPTNHLHDPRIYFTFDFCMILLVLIILDGEGRGKQIRKRDKLLLLIYEAEVKD